MGLRAPSLLKLLRASQHTLLLHVARQGTVWLLHRGLFRAREGGVIWRPSSQRTHLGLSSVRPSAEGGRTTSFPAAGAWLVQLLWEFTYIMGYSHTPRGSPKMVLFYPQQQPTFNANSIHLMSIFPSLFSISVTVVNRVYTKHF